MIIGIAVWDTDQNARSWMTRETLLSLARTVDWDRHRLIVSDNGSCKATKDLYKEMKGELPFRVIYNGENLGTANAINMAWRLRESGEAAAKMDNDVVILQPGWADLMEEAFARDPAIGICGLKRKDLDERPDHPNLWYRSRLRMLPHKKGQRWLIVEECQHIMGTCQSYSSALLDKIGYLYQPGVYGFDDSLASLRAHLAGFKTVFLHGIEIDHIDPGGDDFLAWKQSQAQKQMPEYHKLIAEYQSGVRPVYYDGGLFTTMEGSNDNDCIQL